MAKKLTKKATSERVSIAGEILPDGRTLVQHTDGGRLEVLNARELAIVDDNGELIYDLATELDKNASPGR